MQGHGVTNCDSIANLDGKAVVGDMHHGVVLDRCLTANADVMDIASQHRTEPDCRSGADVNVSYQSRVIGQKHAVVNLRRDAAKASDDGHEESVAYVWWPTLSRLLGAPRT